MTRSAVASGVTGEPQPASRVFATRKGAENYAAREQAYSDRINDGLVWDAAPVENGWMAFVTEPSSRPV